MNGQLRSKVVPVKYKKKNLTEEFDQKIEYMNKFLNCMNLTQLNEDEIKLCVAESVRQLKELIENEYFQLNYIHNPITKQFVLRIIEICFEKEQNYEKRMEMFKIIEYLIDWDVNLFEIKFSYNSQIDYEHFFINLIPSIKWILKEKKEKDTDHNNNLLSVSQSDNLADLAIFSCNPQSIISFIKSVSYMFLCVKFSNLIKYGFIQDSLDFLLDNMFVSPSLSSELTLAISVNICGYGRDKDSDLKNLMIEEEIQQIFDKCSSRAVYLMELNVRNESCRNLLKKALNIYCENVTLHLNEIDTRYNIREGVVKYNCKDTLYEESIVFNWRQLLYKIVVSVVKILRTDFENEHNEVDIELVIYFYELLKANLESLTYEDSMSIAQKLMDIIVKINEWSNKSKQYFKSYQFDYLKSLSFELTIKFMTILKNDFCKTHLSAFEGLWLKSLEEWDLLAFKAISAFCQVNDTLQSFTHLKILARGIQSAWFNNFEKKCACKSGKMKNPKDFINAVIIDSVVDLALAYDTIVQSNQECLKDFLDDIYPILKIYSKLFKSINKREHLVMFVKFYCKIFRIKSSILKNFDYWNEHLQVIVYNLNLICEKPCLFEVDNDILTSSLDIISNVIVFMGNEQEVWSYRDVFESVLVYACKNSNIVQINQEYHDLFSLFKIKI